MVKTCFGGAYDEKLRGGSLGLACTIRRDLNTVLGVGFEIVETKLPQVEILEEHGRILQLVGEVLDLEADPVGRVRLARAAVRRR